MAGILQPIQDVLTALSAMVVTNQDNQQVSLFSRIWNKQLDYLKDGTGYVFPRPAAFVEVINGVSYQVMGEGFRNADLVFRIHLVQDYYNEDGTMEQDLLIFALRDLVASNSNNPNNPGLSFFVPTCCTPLVCISETQDFGHDNVYHYIMDFSCNFTDSKASPYDTGAGQYDDTPNPNMDATITPQYIIP